MQIFRDEVEPHSSDIEGLNQQANELTKDYPKEQSDVVREPMSDVNRRWRDLVRGITDRQNKLQLALLSLGQFQHAIDELLGWLVRTEKALDDIKPIAGDNKSLEIELAKHKVSRHSVITEITDELKIKALMSKSIEQFVVYLDCLYTYSQVFCMF